MSQKNNKDNKNNNSKNDWKDIYENRTSKAVTNPKYVPNVKPPKQPDKK